MTDTKHNELALEYADPAATMTDDEKKRYRRLMWKLDLVILPLTALLYLCASLDRGNIGNAKLQGLMGILDNDSTNFSIALMSFYVTYIVFNVPGNILATVILPNRSLAMGALIWGAASTCQAAATNLAGVVVCRLFIGIGEAGFGVAVALYYSMWYRRDQTAKRVSLYVGSGSIAGAFSGLIAYGVSFIHSKLEHFRILFLIEGLPTILLAVIVFFCLPSTPEKSKYITSEERELLLRHLAEPGFTRTHRFDKSAFKRVFSTPTTYLNAVVYLGLNLTLGSVSGFLPTIIESLGWTAAKAQLFTVPPYAVAFVGTMIASVISDRFQTRGIPIMCLCLFSAVGFAILLGVDPKHKGARYFGVFPAVLGCFSIGPLMMSWASNTAGSHSASAIRLGFMNGVGQCFSILASFSFPAKEGPRYFKGFALNLAFNVVMALAALALTTIYRRENRRRDQAGDHVANMSIASGVDGEKYEKGGREEGHIEDYGNLHDLTPGYRYIV